MPTKTQEARCKMYTTKYATQEVTHNTNTVRSDSSTTPRTIKIDPMFGEVEVGDFVMFTGQEVRPGFTDHVRVGPLCGATIAQGRTMLFIRVTENTQTHTYNESQYTNR